MPGAAGLCEAAQGAFWAPGRAAAICPAQTGFQPVPRGSRKKLPYPSILTKATGYSYSARPLISPGQKVNFRTKYLVFSQGHAVCLGNYKRNMCLSWQESGRALLGRQTLLKATCEAPDPPLCPEI